MSLFNLISKYQWFNHTYSKSLILPSSLKFFYKLNYVKNSETNLTVLKFGFQTISDFSQRAMLFHFNIN